MKRSHIVAAKNLNFVNSVNVQLRHRCVTHYVITHYWTFF